MNVLIMPIEIVTLETRVMVTAYVRALSRDQMAAEDLAQEVFVRALARIDRLRNPEDPGPFLRGIARHVVQEHFRKVKWDRSYVHATIEGIASEAEEVWQRVSDEEIATQLADAVETLPVLARRMLEMRYHDGLDAKQIGRSLGVSAGAVRITLMRVRERLRRRIGD